MLYTGGILDLMEEKKTISLDVLGQVSGKALLLRSIFGGFLMGLANLVPGISGGTMLLASGIYPAFIDALAELTRFRFRVRSLIVLGAVVASAGIGILLLAGTLKELVVHQRWVMYSIFIGLTLGGIPIVWKLARPASPVLVGSVLASFFTMVILAILQSSGIVGQGSSNFLMLSIAGLAGASAMILPGLSGGYLLLLLGQYVPILGAIDQFKDALSSRDLAAAISPGVTVLLPVGIGVIAGVLIVGNLLEWLLRKFQKATLGMLLGLLLGSTVGLWPFQEGIPPVPGEMIKGSVVTVENQASIDPEDWSMAWVRPRWGQVAISLLLISGGVATTMGVAKMGAYFDSDKIRRRNEAPDR
jgi:putative membrane protein